jgi:hypothetical protein
MTPPYRCSFCNKDQNEVSKLIPGPKVFICDECVPVRTTQTHLRRSRRYDSEDKQAVARLLYEALVRAGLSVWFDEAASTLGSRLLLWCGVSSRIVAQLNHPNGESADNPSMTRPASHVIRFRGGRLRRPSCYADNS